MASLDLTYRYEHAVSEVWSALTNPTQMEQWMVGAKPQGFSLVVGQPFSFVGRPRPGWNGMVNCILLELTAQHRLLYLWKTESGAPSYVSYDLWGDREGTIFRFRHEGLTGFSGQIMAAFFRRVRNEMFQKRLPMVLREMPRL